MNRPEDAIATFLSICLLNLKRVGLALYAVIACADDDGTIVDHRQITCSARFVGRYFNPFIPRLALVVGNQDRVPPCVFALIGGGQ